MWLTTPAGFMHHEDFLDTIAQNVDIYRLDIEKLSEKTVHFTNGETIEADGLLYGTGFREEIPIFTKEQCAELGLPHSSTDASPEWAAEWGRLEEEAKEDLVKRFPVLASPPPVPENYGDTASAQPFRLYRNIAPLNDSSIAFVGFATVTNMFYGSELGAIWATAFLDGRLKLPDAASMKKEIAFTVAYMKLRCPTYGKIGNFYVFDFFAWSDGLLAQLGFTSHRKGWWRDLVTPTLIADLKGCKDEYLEKYPSVEDK